MGPASPCVPLGILQETKYSRASWMAGSNGASPMVAHWHGMAAVSHKSARTTQHCPRNNRCMQPGCGLNAMATSTCFTQPPQHRKNCNTVHGRWMLVVGGCCHPDHKPQPYATDTAQECKARNALTCCMSTINRQTQQPHITIQVILHTDDIPQPSHTSVLKRHPPHARQDLPPTCCALNPAQLHALDAART